MSLITEQNSVSSQVDTIMKNRYRRFRYLMRNNRIDDAMAIADEVFEWLHPDFMYNKNGIEYYCSDELEEEYLELLILNGDLTVGDDNE